MSRFVLFGAMSVTCLLTIAANLLVSRILGINAFTVKTVFILPMGAFFCGMMGASGAVLAVRHFNIRPTQADAVVMIVTAAAAMTLIYYLDYLTLVFADGRRASDLFDFSTYVDAALTKLSVWGAGRVAQLDLGEPGRWGYALATDEFLGLLAGGAVAFGLLQEFPRCRRCESYLRKLKTKKSPELTFDEAEGLLEMFRTGDRAAIEEVIGRTAPARRPGLEKAVLNFALHGCPICNAETVIVTVATSRNSRKWKEEPSIELRRCLAGGRSLRDRFT